MLEPGRVVVPREVGLALRGGRTHRTPATALPPVEGTPVRPGTAEHGAAGSATEAVRLVGEALGVAGRTTLTARRTGGLGVRELRRVAVALDVEETVAALVLQTAHAAGLLDADGEESPSWMPTAAADTWAEEPVEVRWAGLALAWLGSDTVASLVGTRDRTGAVRGALSDEVRRPSSAALRRDVLVRARRRAGRPGRAPGGGARPPRPPLPPAGPGPAATTWSPGCSTRRPGSG